MKRFVLGMALVCSFAIVFAGCGGSDDEGSGGDESSSDTTDTAEVKPPRTAEEKLVGSWDAIISFDNDLYDEAREKLSSDEERDALDDFVGELMGSIMHMEFGEDGSASSTKPGDSSRVAKGEWEIDEDKNDTATVTIALMTGGGEEEIELNITFKDDDNFTAPFDPAPMAKGFFYLDCVRVGDSS